MSSFADKLCLTGFQNGPRSSAAALGLFTVLSLGSHTHTLFVKLTLPANHSPRTAAHTLPGASTQVNDWIPGESRAAADQFQTSEFLIKMYH